ncbi:MAG: hypothetical protein AAFY56_16095 [Pseudomonadota bacterium]
MILFQDIPISDPYSGSPATNVLLRIGHELQSVAEAVGALQDSIGDMLIQNESVGPTEIHALQNIDRVTQTVSSLAEFLRELAVSLPPDWLIDTAEATKSVPLLDLAARLSGETDLGDSARHEAASGECTLF